MLCYRLIASADATMEVMSLVRDIDDNHKNDPLLKEALKITNAI
jgi:hypothetical protein